MIQQLCMGRVLVAALGLSFAAAVSATPLAMNYSVVPNGSSFDYSFQLTLDNHDGSWAPGQSFNWVIFGDDATGPGALTDFSGSLPRLPVGPFTDYDVSGGSGHHGPTFLDFVGEGWIPAAIGDGLVWSGRSSRFLGQGELLFSNIAGDGERANYEVATLNVPEPSTLTLVLAGLGLLGGLALRRNLTQPHRH